MPDPARRDSSCARNASQVERDLYDGSVALPARICVFCGSSSGLGHTYADAAATLGRCLAEHGVDLVYGGASVGLMGVLADTVLASGGEVVGVIPRALAEKEVSHDRLTRLHVVGSMHERKALMADLSGAFIALPGGFGTVEELCEIITWGQLGFHRKPIGLLNVDGYFDSLLEFFDRAVHDRFVRSTHRGLVIDSTSPAEILASFSDHRVPSLSKRTDRSSL